MKEIKLTKGHVAIVDAQDYEWLSQWKWHYNAEYACRMEGGKKIRMHRQIMETPDGLVTDHINGNTLDNRRGNLRNVTRGQNRMWAEHDRETRGISFHKKRKKWMAYVSANGKRKHIGYYDNMDDAARAYNAAALTYYGEYAKLNTVKEF